MSDRGIESGSELSSETSKLLGKFLLSENLGKVDTHELASLIQENDLEDNKDFCDARDYILKLAEGDNTHPDLPQVLYVMMTHIMYYQVPKDNRLNFQNRDIGKTANTVCSLCQFALGERKRG